MTSSQLPLPDFSSRSAVRLAPFLRSDGSSPARWPTHVRLTRDEQRLWVRFDCRDPFRWATMTRRDDELWREEVVEIFIAPGPEIPRRYFEIEVNPLGALFDAVIDNPDGRRDTMSGDVTWDCPGIHWRAGSGPRDQDWWAVIGLPWHSLLADHETSIPDVWRVNFFRVERPQGIGRPEADEYSCWSPTYRQPADFHLPEYFGYLLLTENAGLDVVPDPHPGSPPFPVVSLID